MKTQKLITDTVFHVAAYKIYSNVHDKIMVHFEYHLW